MRLCGRVLASAGGGGRWRVTIIEEGVSKRGFPRYPGTPIREAVEAGLFEGRPCLMFPKLSSAGRDLGFDHQNRIAAVGRSAMNQVGHYEDTRWTESANGAPGRAEGVLVLALGDPDADALDHKLQRLQESGGLGSLGLSIDADAELSPSGAVTRFFEVSSVDVVTKPGMGGAFQHRIVASTSGARTMDLLTALRARHARLIEGYDGPALETSVATHIALRLRESEEARAELIAAFPESEREAHRVRLVEGVDSLALLDEAQMLISIVREGLTQAAGAAVAAESGMAAAAADVAGAAEAAAATAEPAATPAATAEPAATPAATETVTVTESAEAPRIRALEERESMRELGNAARRANLPAASRVRLLRERDGQVLTTEQIARICESEAQNVDALLRERAPGSIRVVRESRDRITDMLAHFFAPQRVARPKDAEFERHGYSLHRLIEAFWGIDMRQGIQGMGARRRLKESVDQTNFDQSFADALNIAVNATYQGDPNMADQAWRKIAAIGSANDFRTHKDVTIGNYGTLPSVPKRGPYNSLATPTDRQETWALGKYGGTEDIAWEDMIDDNLGIWQEMVRRMGLAARETLNDAVFSMTRFATLQTMSDGNALMDSARTPANAGTTPLTNDAAGWAALMAAATAMMGNNGGGGKAKGIKPSTLIIPKEKAHIVGGLLADFGSNSNAADFPGRQGLSILGVVFRNVVVDLYTSNAFDWSVIADPSDAPVLKVAFLNGREEPELFFDDNANVSTMFTQDVIRAKIRHTWAAWSTDWVGIYGNDAAS